MTSATDLAHPSLPARFFRWWVRELTALVPEWRFGLFGDRRVLLARPDGDALDLRLDARRGTSTLGTLADLPARQRKRLMRARRKGRLGVTLGADPGRAVRRALTLPAIAETELDALIGFEIERLSPFERGEIFFGHRIIGRNAATRQLDIELAYVRRADFAPALAALETEGLTADRLDLLDAEGLAQGFDLLPPTPKGSRLGRRVSLGMTAMLALLCLAFGAATIHQKRAEVAALEERLAETRRAVLGIRAAVDEEQANVALRLLERKKAQVPVVEIVNEISKVLPDDTWLTRLEIEDGLIELSGESDDSAALIDRFERHPLFSDPVFRAPITRQRGTDRERFLLTLRHVRERGVR